MSSSGCWKLWVAGWVLVFCGAASAQTRHVLPLCFCGATENAPVSATRTLDYEPAEGSSDAVPVHAEEVFFRDSAGRTRSELHYPGQPVTIHIIDPVANSYVHWIAGDTVAYHSEIPAKPRVEHQPVKLPSDAPVVEGVPTRHNRWVSHDKEIEKINESWYSPDLSLAMVTIVDQSGYGKTSYRFVHVKREEPDAALFHASAEMTVQEFNRNPQPPPPPARLGYGTMSPSQPALPHPIRDDNYLEAMTRFQTAVPLSLAAANYHMHTVLKVYELSGRQSTATRDYWASAGSLRMEETAPGWHRVLVKTPKTYWAQSQGLMPLRLMGGFETVPRLRMAEGIIRAQSQGYIGLTFQTDGQLQMACTQNYAGAFICFDRATGFPLSASAQDETVEYSGWKLFGGGYYPTSYRLLRGKRLQVEATIEITDEQISVAALEARLTVALPAEGLLTVTGDMGVQVLSPGQVESSHMGEAMVRVEVDASGRVRKAELLDADDKAVGEAAVKAAKKAVYMPFERDGVAVPFVTTYSPSQITARRARSGQ